MQPGGSIHCCNLAIFKQQFAFSLNLLGAPDRQPCDWVWCSQWIHWRGDGCSHERVGISSVLPACLGCLLYRGCLPANLPTHSVLLRHMVMAVCIHKCTELAQCKVNCCAKSQSGSDQNPGPALTRQQSKQQKYTCFLHVLEFFFLCMVFELCLTVELCHATASPCLWGKLQRLYLDKSKRFVLWRSREGFRGLKLTLSTCRGERNNPWEAENILSIKRMRKKKRYCP